MVVAAASSQPSWPNVFAAASTSSGCSPEMQRYTHKGVPGGGGAALATPTYCEAAPPQALPNTNTPAIKAVLEKCFFTGARLHRIVGRRVSRCRRGFVAPPVAPSRSPRPQGRELRSATQRLIDAQPRRADRPTPAAPRRAAQAACNRPRANLELSQPNVTPSFKSSLRTTFAPLLREHGFQGSGVTFRRLSDPVLQVIHLQGSRAGDSCCVEIGTHLLFLPTVMEDAADPKKIADHDCEFRRRLAPIGESDCWWSYGKTDQDAALSVGHLVEPYSAIRDRDIEPYRLFPGPFALVTAETLRQGSLEHLPGATTVARAALAMARISLHRRLPGEALAFVAVGLDELDNGPPDVGSSIRRRLDDLRVTLERAG